MARQKSACIELTFLIYRCPEDPLQFVAHCLELDVVAVERNRPRAIDLLKELIEDLVLAAIKDGTLKKIFRPAPREYWERLASAKLYEPPEHVKNHRIDAKQIAGVKYIQAA